MHIWGIMWKRETGTGVGTGVLVALVLGATGAAAQQAGADSAAVAATVQRFHAALAAGDSAVVLAQLAPDVRILESGGIETFEQYREGHLGADIGFARAVPSQRDRMDVWVRGDVAWAVSTSTTQGTYNNRAVNSVGAELMVLTRGAGGWKISAIHWSSRQRR